MVGPGDYHLHFCVTARRLEKIFGMRERKVCIFFRMNDERRFLETGNRFQGIDLVHIVEKACTHMLRAEFTASVNSRDGCACSFSKRAKVGGMSQRRPQ